MRIFISDLHLGDGSRTDDFHRDKEFLKFLEFVQDQAEELIITGDFLELWQADLDKALFCHSEVINKLMLIRNKIKLSYVIGNHDYIPFAKFANSGLGICLQYRDQRSGIIAEHGHKYDIFNRYKNPLRSIRWPAGKYFTFGVATLERFIHPNVDQWMRRAMENFDEFLESATLIKNKISPSSPEYIKRGGHFAEFDQAVKGHLRKGARVVIFGHTHKAQLQQLQEGIYANCGTWVNGATPTYIASYWDRIELREALSHNIIEKIELSS